METDEIKWQPMSTIPKDRLIFVKVEYHDANRNVTNWYGTRASWNEHDQAFVELSDYMHRPLNVVAWRENKWMS